MKRSIVAALACAVLAPAAVVLAADTGTGPRLATAVESHDFGKVRPGVQLEQIFTLRNEGEAPLLIEGVDASCGCTAVDFPRQIAPGAEGKLEVHMDSTQLIGKTTSYVIVRSNDPQRPEARLEVSVEVEPVVTARPGNMRFIYTQHEPLGTITPVVYALDDQPFTILGIETDAPVTTEVSEATAEDRIGKGEAKQWKVDVTLAADAPVGPLAGFVSLRTDHPEQQVVNIPISGFVRPVAFVTPPEATLGDVSLTSLRRVPLTMTNFATEPIKVTRATTDIEGASVEIETVEEGRRYRAQLVLGPQVPAGELTGEVVLYTDSYKVPSLRVPVSGRVTSAGPAGDGATH